MHRLTLDPRRDWQSRVESVGLTYHSLGKEPGNEDGLYWYEGAAYQFTASEVDIIEDATKELHNLCMKAADYVILHSKLMSRFGIPEELHQVIRRSWERGDPYVMGRFDLAYDPSMGECKMLEYNADTPTLAIETALVQWFWLNDTHPGCDQFNSLHEKLIDRYRFLKKQMPPGSVLHVSALKGVSEEQQHTLYFRDLMTQASLVTKSIDVEDIGWCTRRSAFVDLDDQVITHWYKLYPWEWLIRETFGNHLIQAEIGLLEPWWKMVLSNKAILPVLWELFPDHPNLLPSYFELDRRLAATGSYVEKPILSREGANVRIVTPSGISETGGDYADQPTIFQGYAAVPKFDDYNVIIGSWVVGEEPAGMILREAKDVIVRDTSRVVPHLFT